MVEMERDYEIDFEISAETDDKLRNLGYSYEDVFQIGELFYRNKKLLIRQINILYREIPQAIFDEGLATICKSNLFNGMNIDQCESMADVAIDMINRANEQIEKARAIELVVSYQRGKIKEKEE